MIKKKINEVKNLKRWRAEKEERYWFLHSAGGKSTTWEDNDKTDDYRYNTGNYFQKEKQAEAKKQFDISSQKIKDSAEGFVPNPRDNNQLKYYIYFDWKSNEYRIGDRNCSQYLGDIYFETEKQAEKCIKENKEHLNVVRDYKG